MTSRPLSLPRWLAPPPRIFVAFRSVSPIPPQYAYTLLRSYYFSPTISSKSVVKSSERTIAISPSEAKPLPEAGFAPVRGLQASACFSSTFFSFDRSLSRCGAQTSFFLHTNSLINSSHVGDAFKRMVAWDFAVFQKVKLGSIFSKVPTVEDPLWTAGVLIVSRSEFFMFNPIVQGRYLFSCCVVL